MGEIDLFEEGDNFKQNLAQTFDTITISLIFWPKADLKMLKYRTTADRMTFHSQGLVI